MSGRKISDNSILEVAGEIRRKEVRSKYLQQVCADPEDQRRLEQRVQIRRRWQFGLRSLLVLMAIAAISSAFFALSVRATRQAQRVAEIERLRAMQALRQAEAAAIRMQAAQAEVQGDAGTKKINHGDHGDEQGS